MEHGTLRERERERGEGGKSKRIGDREGKGEKIFFGTKILKATK